MYPSQTNSTANKLTMVTVNEAGEEVTEVVDEPEAIHTFAEWKKAGFMVKKGKKAIAKFAIWNYASKPSKKAVAEAEKNGEEVSFTAHTKLEYYKLHSFRQNNKNRQYVVKIPCLKTKKNRGSMLFRIKSRLK